MRPLLVKACQGCHGPAKQQASLRLDSREALMRGGEPKIVKGRPYLLEQAMPNFYFHITTAYNLTRHNGVELIKGDRIQLIVNTPRGQDTFFDEKAIRRAAVLARIPTITTLAAARAAAEGIAALQRGTLSVFALQTLHSDRIASEAKAVASVK